MSRMGEEVLPLSFRVPDIRLWESGDFGVIVGLPGSGKTALAVKMMLQAHEMGYCILTNVDLDKKVFKNYTKLDSDTPSMVINQLWELFERLRDNPDGILRFIFLDELYKIVDSQEWKKATGTTGLWMQANKLGITFLIGNQSWGMTYNRVREITIKKYRVSVLKLPLISVKVGLLDIDAGESEVFRPVYRKPVPVDIYPVFSLYDTRQIMYF